MILQSIPFAAGAAGANVTIPVALSPGTCGLLIAAVFTVNFAGDAVAFVTLNETGQALSMCVFGETQAAGLSQSVNAGLDVSTVPGNLGAVTDPVYVNVSLPRYVLQQNFSVTVGGPIMGGADTVDAGRIVVAFGELWELLSI